MQGKEVGVEPGDHAEEKVYQEGLGSKEVGKIWGEACSCLVYWGVVVWLLLN